MKPFVMLVLFICLCNLYALAAPTNLRATAIGHDAFTLRWDAVAGATGYEVEVLEGVDEYLVDTGFEGLSAFPEGWLSASATVYNHSSFAHGGSYLCTITSNTGFVRLPAFSEPAILKFWIRCSNNSSVFTLKIQESHDGVNWLDIKSLQAVSGGSGEVTPTYNEFIIPLANPDNQNKYVRFYRSAGTFTPFIDDIRLQNANHYEKTAAYHASRLNDLAPATDYYFRIRAIADLQAGPFSNWQSIKTLAEAPANAAYGSAIGDSPALIDLPPIGTYPQQSIEIAPSIVG